MRRSTHVTAPLLAAAALATLTGCRQKSEMQRCIDLQHTVVSESHCQSGSSDYRLYYGGDGSFDEGTTATGGSLTPLTGHRYSTTRGGFGSSFGDWFFIAAFVGIGAALSSGS